MWSRKLIRYTSALLCLLPLAGAAETTPATKPAAPAKAAETVKPSPAKSHGNVIDLGTLGPVYDITEPDAMVALMAKLEAMKKSGQMAKLEEEWKRQAVRSAENPPAVAGLTRTQQPRSYLWDPTVTASQDIRDAEGNVLVPAGTQVNPFSFTNLSQHLLLFDARDKDQVAFAQKVLETYGQEKVKLILTGGAPLSFMREHKLRVFYDQNGGIVRRLGIKQVPAIVSQEGMHLRVSELTP